MPVSLVTTALCVPLNQAAVLYVFRTLVDDSIPLNAGCLKPLTLVLPEGSMVNPKYPAAVVAGNVEVPPLFKKTPVFPVKASWTLFCVVALVLCERSSVHVLRALPIFVALVSLRRR
jgi:hypothetical protein